MGNDARGLLNKLPNISRILISNQAGIGLDEAIQSVVELKILTDPVKGQIYRIESTMADGDTNVLTFNYIAGTQLNQCIRTQARSRMVGNYDRHTNSEFLCEVSGDLITMERELGLGF